MAKIDNPAVVQAMETAFGMVWSVLYAHLPPEGEMHKDVGITLSRTLVALAGEGITDISSALAA